MLELPEEELPPVAAPSGGLVRSGIVVAASVALANGLTALYHVVVARVLSPSQYSLLASLLAVVLVLTVPTLAVQAAVARELAQELHRGHVAEAGALLRSTLRTVSVAAVAVAVLGGAVAYPLVRQLGGGIGASYAAAGTVAAALLAPAVWGGLQGAQRFVLLGGSQALVSVLRLALGAGFAFSGAQAGGALAGVAIGAAVASLVSLLPLRGLLASGARAVASRRLPLPYAGGAAAALSLFTALTAVDVVVARAAFDGDTAGAYAAASLGARTVLLASLAATTVLFPRVTTLGDRAAERRHLLLGVGMVGAVAAVGTAFAWPFGGPLVRGVFGARYGEAGQWLGPLAVAMALYAIANVYVYHFLSLGRTRVVAVLAPLFALQLAALALFHGRPLELVKVQIGCAAALVVACEVFQWRRS